MKHEARSCSQLHNLQKLQKAKEQALTQQLWQRANVSAEMLAQSRSLDDQEERAIQEQIAPLKVHLLRLKAEQEKMRVSSVVLANLISEGEKSIGEQEKTVSILERKLNSATDQ